MKQIFSILIALIIAILALFGCKSDFEDPTTTFPSETSNALTEHSDAVSEWVTEFETNDSSSTTFPVTESPETNVNLNSLPEFNGSPYIVVNNNVPVFTDEEITTKSFEYYSPLDYLGRCGTTLACVGKDIMPTEERGEIGQVKPTGWHTVKYDCVDGKYLYNRCHLIGFQLTGENANKRNLITGTRYMNVDGMLPFENDIADYVKSTGNHVMYRVTPIFKGTNILADGVHMEAYSVEDNGKGVSFNVFCYNAQPGVDIDYSTGESKLSSLSYDETTTVQGSEIEYILNTNSKKFHLPNCSSANSMSDKNKAYFTGTRDKLINDGYSPCGYCKP